MGINKRQADPLLRASSSTEGLCECLRRLQNGPWRFLQLRCDPVDDKCIDADDVDLLGSRESVDWLIDACHGWMQQGFCHVAIRSNKPSKVELTLFSLDGCHRIEFDLWIKLAQFDNRRLQLIHDDCAPVVRDRSQRIGRLRVDIESSIYVQHLVCKRKDLAGVSPQRRLGLLEEECLAAGYHPMAALLNRIRGSREISSADERLTLAHLQSSLLLNPVRRSVRGGLSAVGRSWLSARGRTSMIVIMGCDGSGKTTLSERVAQQAAIQSLTGKHLYRKTLSYKLAVIFLRPLITRSREKFDEILAPLLFLRAAISLRMKSFRGSLGTTLIDRSLIDFLYVDRKTSAPRFSRGRWLASLFGIRIPTIHLHVSFDHLMNRKQEMSAQGQRAYDRDMFLHFTRRVPTDYVAFNNNLPCDQAERALQQVIAALYQTQLSPVPPDALRGREEKSADSYFPPSAA